MTKLRIGAVILAAGYSSRMGALKPLLEIGGQTMLAWCARLFLRPEIEHVIVVSGHRAAEVEAEAARLGLATVHNPEFDQGMFSSVRAAVGVFSDYDAFFLLPVDIPLVRPAVVTALLERFDGRIAYPCFRGERGHPPLVPARHIAAILNHDAQGGLKTVLETLPGLDVPVWDSGVTLDADTPEALAELGVKGERLHIGTRDEAQELATIAMPTKGVAHGQAVARVADRLAQALNGHGLNLDGDLVHNAALLHDIAKGQREHEARGAVLLEQWGLHGLCAIVGAHRDVSPPASGDVTAKEVVCLADKLVRGLSRVSVRQRFEEKMSLYAHDQEACLAIRGRMMNALGVQKMVEQVTGQDIERIVAGGE